MNQERFLDAQKKIEYHVELKFIEKKNQKLKVSAFSNSDAIKEALGKIMINDRNDIISVKISYIGRTIQ